MSIWRDTEVLELLVMWKVPYEATGKATVSAITPRMKEKAPEIAER